MTSPKEGGGGWQKVAQSDYHPKKGDSEVTLGDKRGGGQKCENLG